MYYCNTIISDGWPKPTGFPTVMQKVLYCYFSVCKDCLIKFCRSFSVSVIDAVRLQAKQLCFEKFSISPAPGCLKVFVKK